MAFKSGSFLISSQRAQRAARAQWHWLAAGCIATGTLGALLLPGAAQAPAIAPADDAPLADFPTMPLPRRASTPATSVPSAFDGLLPVPAADTRTASVKPSSKDTRITIEINQGPVTDLLSLIAKQGNFDIIIGDDVDESKKIPYVSLTDVTPEGAIRNVAMAGHLVWKKLDSHTYFVGKTIPAELQETSKKAPAFYTPVGEYSGGSSATFNPGQLPQLNADGDNNDNTAPFPALAGMSGRHNSNSNRNDEDDEPRDTHPVRVRNVRPGVLAWWIDPAHNPVPIEFATSMRNNERASSPFHAHSPIDPDEWTRMRGGSSSQAMPFFNPYAAAATYGNPYANAYSPYMQQMQVQQPQYRANYQFGFGQQQQGQQQQGGRGFGQQGNGTNGNNGGGGGGSLELPEGVDQMIAIDAQNVLLVHATAEGLARLQTIIEYLDRPIRQVEIESQFINVATSESKAFGIQFGGPDPNANNNNTTTTGTTTGTTTDNTNNSNSNSGLGALPGVPGVQQAIISIKSFRAVIQSLVGNGRARVINSPRVTTMNNLTATLTSVDTQVFALSQTDQGIGGQTSTGQTPLELDTGISLTVTPTINNDDTITVFLIPTVGQSIPPVGGGGSSTSTTNNSGTTTNGNTTTTTSNTIPQFYRTSTQTLQTVANVKDNDVIVLGGLRTRTESVSKTRIPILSRIPIIGKLFRSSARSDNDSELVIFLTARILRRSDSVTPIEGP